jgi:biopolymer transport protein ExbB
MKKSLLNPSPRCSAVVAAALCLTGVLHAQDAWWDKAWTQRQKITLDTADIQDAAGETTVLIRLSEGRFQFASSETGKDIRFIAADGKTILPHHVETYDSLLNEAFVWVKLPDVKAGAKETFHLYYGNLDPAMPAGAKATDAYSEDLSAVYHFAQSGSAPADATANGNNAETPAVTAEGAIIGNGLRLLGNAPVTIPNSPTLAWTAGQDLSLSLWIKPAALQANAVVLSRTDGNTSFRLLLDQGVPVVETRGSGSPVRSQPGAPIAAGAWSHLALTASGGKLQLHVNGEPYATADGVIPALASPLVLGGTEPAAANTAGFTGELDEFRISKAALSAPAVKFAFINQGGSDAALRAITLGEIEGGGEAGGSHVMEHVMLFGDIANNMMFDGWIAIGVCVIMIVVGWTVAIKKFFYLNKIERGNREFLRIWKSMSTDLTALDHADASTIRSMGGTVDEEEQELMKDSPLYHIYHIGSEEISHRLDKMSDKIEGLPGRSIQAIRASLDAGLVHENHRLTDGLVYLTISIAGGPYVGLLGTVVGVMITFAIIAKSGEVNVNSIAPGIASALLATVVGLVVAIPALFIYSYLNGRIKNVMASMQVFIDEFVAKMAEFYRPKNDNGSSNEGFTI